MKDSMVMCGNNIWQDSNAVAILTYTQATELAIRLSKKHPHAVYKIYKLDSIVTSEVTTIVEQQGEDNEN